jgi:pyruvate kinase
MVTLPTEAGKSDQLVGSLLAKGMNCARINCAHDDPSVWLAMIDNVRRASAATGRPCRILMDLAGHKLRTGNLELQPAAHHIKVKRDIFGNIIGPADVLLVEHSNGHVDDTAPADLRIAIDSELHHRLQSGDRLYFRDNRGKERYFDLLDKTDAGEWRAWSKKSAYLADEALLQWQRPDENGNKMLGDYPLRLPDGKPVVIQLFIGDLLLLTYDDQPGCPATHDADGVLITPARIACSIPEVLRRLRPGDPVWIDDGKLGAEVEQITAEGVLLRVTHAGPKGVKLQTGKGINFPSTPLNLPPLTEKDLEDLDFVCQHADMIGFSFVETLGDMDCLIQQLARRGARHVPIIAKVETDRAVKNLPEIILGTIGRHPLGVMIARGDLAVELGSARLAEIQEELLWLCEAAHVPVIWETQVLESLAKKGVRSRPEFTDAAMGVRADCVMLNKGPYIEETVRALDDVLSRMQAHHQKNFSRLRALHW